MFSYDVIVEEKLRSSIQFPWDYTSVMFIRNDFDDISVPKYHSPHPCLSYCTQKRGLPCGGMINSLWPSDVICRYGNVSTLAQVMARCLMTLSDDPLSDSILTYPLWCLVAFTCNSTGIPQGILITSFLYMSWKITNLRLQPHFPMIDILRPEHTRP